MLRDYLRAMTDAGDRNTHQVRAAPASTAATTESRICYHLVGEFKDTRLADLSLKPLQAFFNAKAASYSRSTVSHLRFDRRSVFKLAIAEGHIERDPTGALFTPKRAAVSHRRSLTKEEVEIW